MHKNIHTFSHFIHALIVLFLLGGYIFGLQDAHATGNTSTTTITLRIVGTGSNTGTGSSGGIAPIVSIGNIRGLAGGGMGTSINGGAIDSPTENLLGAPTEIEDSEMDLAFARAQKNSITHAPTKLRARLYAPISRGELAKMMVQYITIVRKQEVVPQNICHILNYRDANIMDAEQKYFISQACSLDIMGRQNNKKDILIDFRPNDPVTRAEFAAVLSRYLYGNTYNGDMNGNTWYVKHLQALHDAHYITQIDTPMMRELRGFVMLILYRIQ